MLLAARTRAFIHNNLKLQKMKTIEKLNAAGCCGGSDEGCCTGECC